jgi:hypothetical protein
MKSANKEEEEEEDIYSFTGFTTHLRVLASSFLRFRDHTQ